ncbi:MAG TPA: helix-turn-helix domain-containing protein [Candidatus Limnocylindria bacterium]|nr:helix-turn-helix domain-containing protein [Candidatus Limnocylindria bacterium]
MADPSDSATSGAVRFEGYELPALLTVDDICRVLDGVVARGTIVRWFRTGQLHGCKPGKAWVIRASRFVADWTVLESDLPAFSPARRLPKAEYSSGSNAAKEAGN